MSLRLPLAAFLLALAAADLAQPAGDMPLAVAGAVIGILLLASDALDTLWLEPRAKRERAIELSNSQPHSR
jgi:hypothetical protein